MASNKEVAALTTRIDELETRLKATSTTAEMEGKFIHLLGIVKEVQRIYNPHSAAEILKEAKSVGESTLRLERQFAAFRAKLDQAEARIAADEAGVPDMTGMSPP